MRLTDTVRLTLNLTRLTDDFDPHVMLSDGQNIVGAVVVDDNGGGFRVERFVDRGPFGARDGADTTFTNFGYPPVGGAFDVTVGFRFTTTSTTVSAAFQNGAAESTESSRILTPSLGLRAELMRDSDAVEQYQLNKIGISVDAVPEPAAAAVLAGPLVLLARPRRRRTD